MIFDINKQNDIPKILDKIEYTVEIVNNPIGTIFYIHSFMGTYQNKLSLREHYSNFNFYALNLPGQGRSIITKDDDIDLLHSLDILKSFINYFKLSNLIMIGHSLGGGMVAALNSILNNEQIKMNIFEAPANGIMGQNYQIISQLVPETIDDMKMIINKMYYDPQKIYGSRLQSLINYEYNIIRQKYLPLKKNVNYEITKRNGDIFDLGFSKINKPSIIIMGESDGILPTELMETHFKKISPNIEQKIISHAAHLVYYEQPEAFLKITDDFINKNK